MIGKLQQLEKDLRADSTINVVNFNLFPGITEKTISDVIREVPVPAAILAFYKETNGLQVRWYSRIGNYKAAEPIEKDKLFDWMWPTDHYWQMDGIINILPLELSMLKDWKDFIWFDFENDYDTEYNGETINVREFKKKVRPLDLYDKSFTVAFYTGDPQLPVLLGEDHNVEFLSYNEANFMDYINFVIDHKGAVRSRELFFKKNTNL